MKDSDPLTVLILTSICPDLSTPEVSGLPWLDEHELNGVISEALVGGQGARPVLVVISLPTKLSMAFVLFTNVTSVLGACSGLFIKAYAQVCIWTETPVALKLPEFPLKHTW